VAHVEVVAEELAYSVYVKLQIVEADKNGIKVQITASGESSSKDVAKLENIIQSMLDARKDCF
jgi:hypothetical protein